MSQFIFRTIILSLAAITVTACQPQNQVDKAAVQEAIDQQNQVFMESFTDRDYERFASLFTEGAWMMQPHGETVKGEEGIKKLMEGFESAGITGIEISTTELNVIDSENVLETGTFKVFADTQQVDNGKYLVYWVNDEGTWKFHRDIWNSNNPMPQPE